MTLVLPGNSTDFIDYTASQIAVSTPTQTWIAGRFRLLTEVPTGSGTLFRIGPNNGGSSLSWSQVGSNTVIRLNHRLLVNGASDSYRTPVIPITVGAWYEFAILTDYTAGYVRIYLDGSEVHEQLKELPEDVWTWWNSPTAAAIPRIAGADLDGKDFEVSHFCGSLSGVISPAEAVALSLVSNDLSTLSAPPTWGVAPSGANGSHAATLEDIYGTNDMTQVAGPVSPDEGFPYFVSDVTSFSVSSAVASARTLTLTGTTEAPGGTVYIVVDTAANIPSAPDAADVAGGFLADGVTAALDFASQAMTGITNFSVALEPLPANTNLAYAIVHDIDDAGDYTAVIYGTISTKRPVIVPATTEKRLLDAGEPVISETGMTMWVLGTEYSQAGYATDSAGLFELDLTEYLNTTGTEDIGDTVDIALTLADGERGIVAMGQTITEGE